MKYNQFKQKVAARLFTLQELRLKGIKIFPYQLTGWQKQSYLLKLKNGVYVFADRAGGMKPEELAGLLYAPSYISLERALSFYGLIPELVYSITAVTPKATRRFSNHFGDYEFRHVKPSLFFGYTQKTGGRSPYLIAEPEKALLDFIYLNQVRSPAALETYRLNWPELKKIMDRTRFKKYAARYRGQKIKALVDSILGRL